MRRELRFTDESAGQLKAMAAEGFVNYAQEWWHYSLPSAAPSDLIYDVPVR